MSPRLAVVDDARFDAHRASRAHPERPERLAAARSGLASVTADWIRVEAREARDEELRAVHSSAYLERLEQALATGHGEIDADTYHCPGSREAAWCAAGGAASLAERLVRGEADCGVALLRPPGHHAESDRAMGFCLLNNVAIAAHAALRAGAARVAIVDWDVHHGNGTQHAFESSPEVLFVSLHEWPLYPGTGAPTDVGTAGAAGSTANLALPSGSGDEVYGAAFREVVLPLLRNHAPDLVLVSAGYDAHARDPLAGMELSSRAFGAMASALLREQPRVAFLLEGGYDLSALEGSVEETVRAALGEDTELPEGRIGEAARSAIDQTLAALRPHLPDGVV